MGVMGSQIAGVSIVYSTVCSGLDQRKHQSSAPLAFVREIRRSPTEFPSQSANYANIFPLDDVIMIQIALTHILAMND